MRNLLSILLITLCLSLPQIGCKSENEEEIEIRELPEVVVIDIREEDDDNGMFDYAIVGKSEYMLYSEDLGIEYHTSTFYDDVYHIRFDENGLLDAIIGDNNIMFFDNINGNAVDVGILNYRGTDYEIIRNIETDLNWSDLNGDVPQLNSINADLAALFKQIRILKEIPCLLNNMYEKATNDVIRNSYDDRNIIGEDYLYWNCDNEFINDIYLSYQNDSFETIMGTKKYIQNFGVSTKLSQACIVDDSSDIEFQIDCIQTKFRNSEFKRLYLSFREKEALIAQVKEEL